MKKINEFPIRVRFPVAWGEMDAFYHVNNVNYFSYFQKALSEYYDKIGMFEMKIDAGIAPVMAESKCNYLQSLTYPDNLVVGTKVKSIGTTSIIMEYLIVSEKLGAAATGESVLVMYDFNKSQKTNVPAAIKDAIIKLEEQTAVK